MQVAPKTQREHDAKWVIVQTRLPNELGPVLDDMRRAEDDVPTRAEMVRRCVEREMERFQRKAAKK